MYSYSRAVAEELRILRLILRLSQQALDHYFTSRPETKRNRELWDHGDQYILESTNEQLNRIIDGAVQIAFASVRTHLTLKDTRQHRNELLRRMEEHFGFAAAGLPGWPAVQEITHDANASKHRSGIHWQDSGQGLAHLAGAVTLWRHDLSRRIYHAGRWVRALGHVLGLP